MSVLLAIDDDPSILLAFRHIFRAPEVTVLTAATAAEGLDLVGRRHPDVVLLDINLPDLSGLETFRRIRAIDARIPIIFITGHGTTEVAIEAMKLGAYEYLLKENMLAPDQTAQLHDLVQRAFEISRLMHEPALLSEADQSAPTGEVLVGGSTTMQAVYKAIGRVAPQDVTVLILGESGTGKELVARAIYQHSKRANGPFLAINCAAIPETLLESELFGHEKGAFTGAERKRIGKFEQCNGGTLFLDEIGDMTPLTQTKVLRVMQEQRFERVGGNEVIQTNVRLIAATNRDLQRAVTTGQFRSDLYYRLSVFTIHLPPLRERGSDLPMLVDHFRKRFNRELGKEVHQIHPETLAVLRRHSWPGNLRELQSVIKQALLHTTGPVLLPEFLPPYIRDGESRPGEPTASPCPAWDQFLEDRLQAGSADLYAEWQTMTERHLLMRVLRFTEGNQVQAAKILGMARNSLRTKIRALGITIDRSVGSGEPDEE
jgi:two-component system nitrogen regulation response regulator GlnG